MLCRVMKRRRREEEGREEEGEEGEERRGESGGKNPNFPHGDQYCKKLGFLPPLSPLLLFLSNPLPFYFSGFNSQPLIPILSFILPPVIFLI